MPRTLYLALGLALAAAVPVRAELVRLPAEAKVVPGEYLVLDEARKGLGRLATVQGELVRDLPLKNFPPGRVLRMTPQTAELVAREGYTVIPDFLVPLLAEPPVQVQDRAPWHLDRNDQRTFPLDSAYRYSYTGRGVQVYVIDSGILPNPDLAARLAPGADFVGDGGGVHASCGEGGTHGTGVASMLGGAKYGVAKGVTIVPVRAGGCDGYLKYSATVASLDWILSDARRYPAFRAVVNMSFGGVGSNVYDPYFKKLDAAGIVLVDAAGNGNIDACRFAPASSQYTISVGGTNIQDERYNGSNWGKCVDLFAPGQNVPSANGPDDQQWSSTGTSGSAPQVAGHVAQLLEQFPQASPGLVRKLLVAKATPGLLGNLGKGSPNLLLHAGAYRESMSQVVYRAGKRPSVEFTLLVPGGGPSATIEARVFRGLPRDGRCQGAPFAVVVPSTGFVKASLKGEKPAVVCVETSLGSVLAARVN